MVGITKRNDLVWGEMMVAWTTVVAAEVKYRGRDSHPLPPCAGRASSQALVVQIIPIPSPLDSGISGPDRQGPVLKSMTGPYEEPARALRQCPCLLPREPTHGPAETGHTPSRKESASVEHLFAPALLRRSCGLPHSFLTTLL